MSSRVLTGEQAGRVRPISWEIAPGGGRAREEPLGAPGEATSEEALRQRLVELQAQAAAREAQARKAGFAEGQAAARQNLEAPYREALERAARSLGELAGYRRRLRREAEEDLVRLAVAIARRILRRELCTDPQAILGLVKAAFDRLDAREVLRIRVHPEDARTLESSFADLGVPERIEVLADRRLERGGLLVETERGELDASVATQLEEIERGLADLIRRQP